MADSNISPVHRIILTGSKIHIFNGKAIELRPWLAALKKKECFYKLKDPELANFG